MPWFKVIGSGKHMVLLETLGFLGNVRVRVRVRVTWFLLLTKKVDKTDTPRHAT